MEELTPQRTVAELDRYIVGQTRAKRAIAVALRNRYRRQRLPEQLADEVTPKNILMIGPTGVGKTEIARRVARLFDAPFIKVEATKFTEVGYVGRDVESIVRDLLENSIGLVHQQKMDEVRPRAEDLATEKLITYLVEQAARPAALPAEKGRRGRAEPGRSEPASAPAAVRRAVASERSLKRRRLRVAEMLQKELLEDETVEIDLDNSAEAYGPVLEFMAGLTPDEMSEAFQEFVENANANRRRSRRVSVRDARRILIHEEAHKLLDLDAIVDAAINRVEQTGVVFIDEIDKIIGPAVDSGPDVSGEGVQRDLLPIVEGSTVMTRYGPVKSDHILFVAAGSFHSVKPTDLIPELQGRFPLRVELDPLGEAELLAILREPENALPRQYTALLGTEDVTLEFAPDGLEEIARIACLLNERSEDIGARRLQTIMEKVLESVSFEASEHAGERILVDGAYVRAQVEDLVEDEDLSRYIL